MNKIQELIREYLPAVNVMQLATAGLDGQPWVSTVHYYSDENWNFYWISTREKRHSQIIEQNPKVSVAIVVHENTPDEQYIIGISIEGAAECIGQQIDEQIESKYTQKLHKPPQLMVDIRSGKNPHHFYRLRPTKIVLFDTKIFPDNPRQEYRP